MKKSVDLSIPPKTVTPTITPAVTHAKRPDAGWLRRGRIDILDQSGSASTIVVCFIPVLMILMAMIFDLGTVLVARAVMRNASDLGALAGVQEVDLDELYHGRLYINEAEARDSSTEWVMWNLEANGFPGIDPESVDIRVETFNTTESTESDGGDVEHQRDPVTGKQIRTPTTCVQLSARSVPWLFWMGGKGASLRVHADASVKTKKAN